MVASLALAMVLAAMPVPPPWPTTRAPIDQPEPQPKVAAVRVEVTGKASWYAYVPGHAAAGPALRKMLGKGWRGTKVQVCMGEDNCTEVILSDSCQCYRGEKRERVIDLDVRAFADLAPTGRGVIEVVVNPL